jgi:hypothetical protein
MCPFYNYSESYESCLKYEWTLNFKSRRDGIAILSLTVQALERVI